MINVQVIVGLTSWSFFLFLVQGEKRDVGYFDNLETDAGNITNGMAFTTETCHQNFVILFNIVETTVSRYESGDLFAVFDQLNSDTLSNSRIRLFSFDTDLF